MGLLAFAVCALMGADQVRAGSAAEISRDAKVALQKLYAKSNAAKELGQKATAILVFPDIAKAGFLVGGQYGEGALLKGGEAVGYYNTVALSYGLQAGVQKYGFALFLMNDSAREYLDRSDGWELGVGPNIVIGDAGAATSLTTTTAQADVYAFFFDLKGLMAGLGIQGNKITKITPGK
jgi:lipid-binding SYLF domain-containing protein